MLLKLLKVLLMNLTEKENLAGVTLLIDTGFARIPYVLQFSVKNFNGFKLKAPTLDVRWFQNSHLTSNLSIVDCQKVKAALVVRIW